MVLGWGQQQEGTFEPALLDVRLIAVPMTFSLVIDEEMLGVIACAFSSRPGESLTDSSLECRGR